MNLVTGALGSVIPKLGELLKEEYDLQTSLRKKITCLSRDLESMHVALRKVGDVPPKQLDEQVKLWARDIRELSYDVEDVVDTFLVRVDGQEARDPNMLKRAAKKIEKLFSKSKARHQIADMIKTINEQAKELAERRDRYKVDEILAKRAPSSTVDPRLEAIYKEVKELVGIEKPSEELISKLSLQGDDSKKKMKTVSVVGVGGLGKTTLVKAVYDKVKVNFKCTAFVPVGQNPDLKKVLRDVLIELDKEKYTDLKFTVWDEKQLIDELREYIGSKRYFIVIDDLWNTETWETIKWAFVKNNNGSRLITTTRITSVADQADEVYNLQPLPYEKSRNLFYTRIFGESRNSDNKLDEISDKILKKCDGVPLAIITMASLLLGKSRGQWIEVCDSIGFRDTVQILSLSYYDLPPHLKACLLYLSAFPEDYLIDKNSLIWKWVAEGFVQKEERTGFFEVGEGYFNELINRSLIMAVELENELMVGCRVHDMVLDVLQEISQEENFVTVPVNDGRLTISPSGKVRRLAHQNRIVELTHHDRHMDLGHVKSLIACNCHCKALSFPSFKLLRVLALEGSTGGIYVPVHLEHLESLLHLRYLGLRNTFICELPEGIEALKFLQTLDLFSASTILELPSSISQLTQLVCLHVGPAHVPIGVIEKLTSLEDLQLCLYGDTMGQVARELGNLSDLRMLHLGFRALKRSMQSDLIDSLGKLQKIQYLLLQNVDYTDRTDQDLWDTLVLPRTLRHLHLPLMAFHALPSPCINNLSDLPNLSHLGLRVEYMDEESLKILGGLPELRHLKLDIFSKVTLTIHPTHGFFQKLRSLVLPSSMVQFVRNEASSSSFTIGNGQHDVAAGTRMMEDAPAVMPNLEVLEFIVNVHNLIRNNSSCANLGLECLPSLQKVHVHILGDKAFADEVEEEEAALRRSSEVHPNQPTLQMEIRGQPMNRRRPAIGVRRKRPTLKSSVQPQPEPDERDGAHDDELARHFTAGTPTFSLGAAPQGSTAARHRR